MLTKLRGLIDRLKTVICLIEGSSRRLGKRSRPILYLEDVPYSYNDQGELEFPIKEEYKWMKYY